MIGLKASWVALVACAATIIRAQNQVPLQDQSSQRHPVKQVAIIGAGSAGSSTAYYLRQFATNASIPINITIYERNSYIGGRSTTIHPYDDPAFPALELGASIFVQVNQNLVSAAKALNLSVSSSGPALKADSAAASAPALGVYDGTKMVLLQQSESFGYWDLAKLFWRYGLAPLKTQKLMKRTVAKFLRMYEAPYFPFPSLTQVVEEVGLMGVVAVTGESYMKRWEIAGDFGHDIVQASTRVNYAMDLDRIHAVEAMVCMAAEGAMSVEGGNWRIFDGMVKDSGAKVVLGTEVVSVSETEEGRMLVVSAPAEEKGMRKAGKVQEFDEVVLAAPHQYAGIQWNGVLRETPDEIPYVNLHTTIFTSKHRLNPTAFGLEKGTLAPRAVLTTTPKVEEDTTAASPNFQSVSLLREIVNPHTAVTEYAYKIFTLQPVDDNFLRRILDLKQDDSQADIGKEDISWIYRKLWQSYPEELPRVTFEEILLHDHVWYTSGIESFISTMETSSLMGMNVARLMVDDWETGNAIEAGTVSSDE